MNVIFVIVLRFSVDLYHEEPAAIVGGSGGIATTKVAVAAVDSDSEVIAPGTFAS